MFSLVKAPIWIYASFFIANKSKEKRYVDAQYQLLEWEIRAIKKVNRLISRLKSEPQSQREPVLVDKSEELKYLALSYAAWIEKLRLIRRKREYLGERQQIDYLITSIFELREETERVISRIQSNIEEFGRDKRYAFYSLLPVAILSLTYPTLFS
jgi:hypothetical protein